MPETLPANWDRLSPTGLVPVIEDGNFTLPDSGAILQYLDAKHPAIPMIPANPRDRGRALWIESYLGAFFRDVMHPLFHQRVVAPMRGDAPDTGMTGRVLSGIAPRYFEYLDGETRGDWLVGEALSIADIAVGANLVLFQKPHPRPTIPRSPPISGGSSTRRSLSSNSPQRSPLPNRWASLRTASLSDRQKPTFRLATIAR
ncbi:glutathione S-transferase family protein [Mesorhizobium sp.]|uniref:glutathione S-transferase family protein n=1 Tax=Mesorhizobium sp. TaxID=1871066 RepID=UPI000FE4B1C5|nr:glutathione S-transferase family protein [Mesorhizobium sp.]RWK37103.1 MAG: glutathione S-transferase family protein [Mesorhizobium sp.]RWK68427.1 MAG: glutathione S-transferase family protein [Mesorhizobium sp.]RWK73819.1 MAG: glutathione S-transferase family protein [Mesorhizobium sp.]RWK84205.1 MAG: glutathione S-transferase family protein [Mesorhizobium sp.]RWL02131.1 MAG: glutathione S-transferase family protein [Mesorhizobium sp.]